MLCNFHFIWFSSRCEKSLKTWKRIAKCFPRCALLKHDISLSGKQTDGARMNFLFHPFCNSTKICSWRNNKQISSFYFLSPRRKVFQSKRIFFNIFSRWIRKEEFSPRNFSFLTRNWKENSSFNVTPREAVGNFPLWHNGGKIYSSFSTSFLALESGAERREERRVTNT